MPRMKLPNNELPRHMQEDVKIVNTTTDFTFEDSWDRMNPNSSGDIVLGPRKYCYRKKYEAMHWFGDWTKTGKEWEAEVMRVGKRYSLLNPLDPTWLAIKEHKLYVEGEQQKADYKTFALTKLVDKMPQFSLNGPEDSTAYVRKATEKSDYLDLPADFGSESADITPLKK